MNGDGLSNGPTSDGSVSDPSVESMSSLERRYRRWMGVFPASYRSHREDELVGVLLDGAAPDQERPRPADVLDLVRAGLAAQFRGIRVSRRRRRWGDAASIVGIVLAVLLGAQGMRFVVHVARSAASAGEYGAAPLAFADVRGWYVPVVWTLVVVLLCAGSTRLAAVAAWCAVVARFVSLVDIAYGPQGSFAGAPAAPWAAQPLVVQLTLAVIAAVLLSGPVRVRATVVAIGRGRLVAVVSVFAAGVLGWRWLIWSASGSDIWVLVVPLVLVVVARAAGVRVWDLRGEPLARRVVIGLVALVAIYWASGAFSKSTGPQIVTGRDLFVTFVVGIMVAVGSVLLIALAPAVARRLPYLVVRRGS